MIVRTAMLSAGALLLSTCGAVSAGQGLVANPGFETDGDSDGVPDGWALNLISWSGSKGTIDWQDAVKHSGRYSVHLAQTNDKGRMTVSSSLIAVKPTVKYSFSGWMKTAFAGGGGQAAYFFFVGFKADGTQLRQLRNTTIVKATTNWTRYDLTVGFGAEIDAVRIYAVIGPGPGAVWIDDVSLVESTPGPDSAPGAPRKDAIANGDFETDADGNNLPDNWRPSDPATGTWDGNFASSGKHSVKIAGKGYWLQRDLPVPPGRPICKVSFKAVTEKFGGKFSVYCEANRDGGAFLMLGRLTDRGEGTRVWHKKEFTFRMPDPEVAKSFYIVLTTIDATVWYDEVRVEVLPEEVGPKVPLPPMAIELTTPYWRNTIYATENLAEIRGGVTLNVGHSAGECLVTVSDSADKILERTSVPCGGDAKSVDFKLPAGLLPVGEYTIAARFVGKGDEELAASCPLRRVGPSDGEIRVRRDNVLLINGKPFFPIGLWPAGHLGEIAAAGFNWVKYGNPDARILSAYRASLKKLEKYGLRAGTELYIYTELNNAKEAADSIKRGIANVRDNATFLGWYVDECVLAGLSPDYAKTLRDALIAGDPHHLLWTSHAPRNTIDEIAAWNRYMDLTWCNIYPYPDVLHSDLPNRTIGVVGDETIKQRKTVKDRKPVWMNLQGFIWEGRPAPTWQATRFMAYDAIINGAKGVIWYNTHQIPRPGPFWSSIKRTAGQLRDISAVLVSPDLTPDLNIEGAKPDQIRYLCKKHEGGIYLLMENRSNEDLAVTVSGIPADRDALRVIFEDRTVPLSDGTLRDNFAAFDVHVYTNATVLPDPLVPPTPAALQYARNAGRLEKLIADGWLSRTWEAEWIWYPGQLKTDNLVVYARKIIHLDSKPDTAWLQIAVDDDYSLTINGREVEAGGWGHAYQVAGHLNQGDNVLAIEGRNGRTFAGILLQGVIGTPKRRIRVLTDASWKVSLTPDAGWTDAGFDDSHWQSAHSIGKPPIKPWRSVPLYLTSSEE